MKGVYILLITVKRPIQISVGALGKIQFDNGNYAYVGSGQNNLEKRVSRHLNKKKKKHWHIDYLLSNQNVVIEKVLYKKVAKKEECRLAQALCKFETPVKGFGSSDCSCESHLIKIRKPLSIEGMSEL